MTNEMIIFNSRLELMKDGKIGTTGRIMIIEDESGKKQISEPEEIHTFQRWKELGYKVKKGEHAIAKIMIWKYIEKKESQEEKEEESIQKEMFMKQACFFSPEQVEQR